MCFSIVFWIDIILILIVVIMKKIKIGVSRVNFIIVLLFLLCLKWCRNDVVGWIIVLILVGGLMR